MNQKSNLTYVTLKSKLDRPPEEVDFYTFATAVHRTHQNKHLKVEGTFLEGMYKDTTPDQVTIKSTQCFHPDSRVLTDKGYIKISDIKIGDMVLTKDSGFQKVKTVFKNKSDDLLNIRADGVDNLLTTKDHPFFMYQFDKEKYHYSYKDKTFIEPELKEISKCKSGDFLIHPLSFEIKQIDKLNLYQFNKNNIQEENETHFRVSNGQRFIPKEIDMDFESGMLFGFFLSEGHTRILGTNVGYSFHTKETNYRDLILTALKNIFKIIPTVYTSEKDSCIRINFNDRALHSFYKEMGQGSYNKKPVQDFYNAPDDFLKGLLYGIFCGDGRLKQKQVSLHVASDELRYFTKWILSKFGYISRNEKDNLSLNADASKFIQELCFKNVKSSYSRSIVLDEHIAVRLKKIEQIEYSDFVYNLEIENDHTYIVNGYIVHNCGISEKKLAKACKKAINGESVIYILPTYDLKNLYVKDRVDRSLAYSNFYSRILSEQPRKAADSASMKQLGKGVIFFAGSNTPNAFISLPCSSYFVDEYDNCNQENIVMLPERQSATPPENRSSEKFGNPTIQNFGIDAEYKKTDKKEWHIKCPHCNKWIHPDFFKHVVMEIEKGIWIVRDPLYTGQEIINPICECGKPYNRFAMGEWIAEYPDRPISGYHVSKMFSTLNTLNELVARFNDGLTNESTMQRVYNGDLGLAYTAKGSKIDAEIIDGCIDSTYYMPDKTDQACIAGIDVGRMLNVCIGQPLSDGKIKMVYINTIRSENEIEIYEAFKKYNVRFFIIDAMPETRFSKKLIAIMNGRGFMNFYASDKRDLGTPNNENAVANSRTQALDAVKEYLLLEKIILPANIRDIKDFYEQLGELTRVYDEKKDCYNWQGEGADHYFHAMAYMVLAQRYLSIL